MPLHRFPLKTTGATSLFVEPLGDVADLGPSSAYEVTVEADQSPELSGEATRGWTLWMGGAGSVTLSLHQEKVRRWDVPSFPSIPTGLTLRQFFEQLRMPDAKKPPPG